MSGRCYRASPLVFRDRLGHALDDVPARWMLLGLLLLAIAPPFVARALGTPFGAFSMFTRLWRYHLELEVTAPAGTTPVALGSLAPHLSVEARRSLLPAQGYALGADQVDVVRGGLRDLARLLCELHPEASSARVRFYQGGVNERAELRENVVFACDGRR